MVCCIFPLLQDDTDDPVATQVYIAVKYCVGSSPLIFPPSFSYTNINASYELQVMTSSADRGA